MQVGELVEHFVKFKKVVIIGDIEVGKSTLYSILADSVYMNLNIDTNKDFTLNVEKANVKIGDDKYLHLNIVVSDLSDLSVATQNTFATLYEAELILMLIDITRDETFKSATSYLNEVPMLCEKNVFFISNKIDLDSKRDTSRLDIKQFMDKHPKMKEFEVSLKEKEGIDELKVKIFETLQEDYSPVNIIKYQFPLLRLQKQDGLNQNTYTPIKLFLLGNSSVGKTSFIKRFFSGKMQSTITTLGVDVERSLIQIHETIYKLEVWDTAGQERLRTIPRQSYNKADGFILVYDVNERKSFEDIGGWVKDIRSYSSRGGTNDESDLVPVILVGNKIDNPDREVSYREGQNFAEENHLYYAEISCLNGLNIQEVMSIITLEAFQSIKGERITFKLRSDKGKDRNDKCCLLKKK